MSNNNHVQGSVFVSLLPVREVVDPGTATAAGGRGAVPHGGLLRLLGDAQRWPQSH